jgi:hypothetical protein
MGVDPPGAGTHTQAKSKECSMKFHVGFAVVLLSAAVSSVPSAFAAGPVRTPTSYSVKANINPNPVTRITLDNSYVWDADSSVRTTFDNRPDAQARSNPVLNFEHRNNGQLSVLDFNAAQGANGGTAALAFRRIGTTGTTQQTTNSGPDANGTTFLGYRFEDNAISADLVHWAARTGYWDVLRSGGYYGAGGFFGVPDEYRTGSFAGGLTTFRFESNQDTGNARLLYNFANDGGESGTVRARLLYLDRNGDDGYNKIRFTYVSNPQKPVSPH